MSGAWDKFYWSDWYSDKGLRLCSYAARGLWMDMLAIAAESREKGYLINGSAPLSTSDLARLTGGTVEEIIPLIAELETHAVFSRDRRGVIYSRKMVRDEIISRKSRDNGKMGGNPSLLRKRKNSSPDNPPDKPRARVSRSQIPDPRDSVLTDSCPGAQKSDRQNQPPKPDPPDPLDQAFEAFIATAKQCGLPVPKRLDADRRKKLKAIIDAHGEAEWHSALAKIRASPFLIGGGQSGWKADFDFLLQPKSFRRLAEGGYDSLYRPGPAAPASSGPRIPGRQF